MRRCIRRFSSSSTTPPRGGPDTAHSATLSRHSFGRGSSAAKLDSYRWRSYEALREGSRHDLALRIRLVRPLGWRVLGSPPPSPLHPSPAVHRHLYSVPPTRRGLTPGVIYAIMIMAW